MKNRWVSALATVRAALMRRGRSSHDAEDIVQEAWLRLAAYEVEHEVERPEAFLMRSALNLSVDMHRSTSREGEVVAIAEETVIIDTTPGPEDTVLGRERAARLDMCLARLSDRTREIFLAHRLEGLTYKQIAQHFGLSQTAVEWHMSRAVLHVSEWMRGW
ncbi:RNA polymerase sigma factor [Piscinibacter sakaiensis]|uniref:RNA polymerase sigma factor n=1 Tax=Piscinibacter sakaiensis TaxID=1547922 RepID=UPI003AAA4E6B